MPNPIDLRCEGCGKPLVRGRRGPAPRRCPPCRKRASAVGRSKPATCPCCGKAFIAKPGRRFCSVGCANRQHGDERRMESRACARCSAEFQPTQARVRFCSHDCADESRRRHADDRERVRANSAKRRAVKLGVESEPYSLAEIALRDGVRCGLCLERVDMRLSGSDVWGPTIDHIVPISKGGADVKANVQLAHRRCNLNKGSKQGTLTFVGPSGWPTVRFADDFWDDLRGVLAANPC